MLAFLLPNLLTPFLTAAVNFGSWYLGELWDGTKTIFSNISAILVVATVAVVALVYGWSMTASCPLNHTSSGVQSIWDNPFKADG